MNDEYGHEPPDRDHFECIDPDLGQELWRLDDPATDSALREKLSRHVEFCDACRVLIKLDAALESAVRDGAVPMPPMTAVRPGWPRLIGGTGALALAASLSLMVLLPPRGSLDQRTMREYGAPAIVRPVADEVIVSARPTITWSTVAGARAYDVSVTSINGEYAWTGRSESASIKIPIDAGLPGDQRYRVRVVPVPPRTASEGGLDSSFRRGSWFAAGRYRLINGNAWAQALGIAGVLILVAGLGDALRRRSVHA